jgi:hypothetical protein
LAPGHYSGAMSTYDGPVSGGANTGQVLSENQSFPIAVVAGHANAASVTLDGVPAWISFTSLGSPLFIGAGNYEQPAQMLGAASHGSMTVNVLDPDFNVILGPGAPVVASAVANTGGFSAKLTGNTIAITAGSPVAAGDWTLTTVLTGPGCAEPNAQCTFQTALAYQPILAVADRGSNSVLVEIASSSIETPLLATIATGISDPRDVKFDRAGNLYLANDAGPGEVLKFQPPYTGAPIATYTNGVQAPSALSLAPNGDVAVSNAGVATTLVFVASSSAPITIPLASLSIAFDYSSNLWIATASQGIKRYTSASNYTIADETIADHVVKPASISVGGNLSLYVADDGAENVYRYDPPYTALSATLLSYGVAGGTGNVEAIGGGNGMVVACAGENNVLISSAPYGPTELNPLFGAQPAHCRGTFDANAFLWVSDQSDDVVRGDFGYGGSNGVIHGSFSQPGAIDAFPGNFIST